MIIQYLRDLNIFTKTLGLVPQEEDDRDLTYRDAAYTFKSIDLRNRFKSVSNQGNYNSCTAQVGAAIIDYALEHDKKYRAWPEFNTSEVYMWYWSRERLGNEAINSGAVLRDVFKTIIEYGFIPEEYWSYKDGVYKEPNYRAVMAGNFFKNYLKQVPKYYNLWSNIGGLNKRLKNALSRDHPVAFGFPIDRDFMRLNKKNSRANDMKSFIGYHALLAVGYTKTGVIARNSWGNRWGDEGYCEIDFKLFEEKAFDVWTLM